MTDFKKFTKRKKCSHYGGFKKKCKCQPDRGGFKACKCKSFCRDCGMSWTEYLKLLDQAAYKASKKAK